LGWQPGVHSSTALRSAINRVITEIHVIVVKKETPEQAFLLFLAVS
jgi:hypothetical protein